jgi:PleD family two-component response regulator
MPLAALPGSVVMMTNKHVLLVDDEKHIREVVEYALAKSGYRVTALTEDLRCSRFAPVTHPTHRAGT